MDRVIGGEGKGKKILSSERVSLSRCSTKSSLDPCRQVVSSESLLENGYSELSLLSLPLFVLFSSLEIVESNLLYKYYSSKIFFNAFFNFKLFFFNYFFNMYIFLFSFVGV